MHIEYRIHDWLGLRLVDPSPSSARLVARQLDPLTPSTLTSTPDVSLVEVHDGPPAQTPYRLGDAGDHIECAFGDSEFCFLKDGRMFCIPFESIGNSCEIRYTPGLGFRRPFINYVRPILQLSLLSKGAMAVHSAAISYKGQGMLFAGWSESGKTEAMLGFLQHGASFVSDKWTIVTEDGSAVHNFPTPMTVRGWVLKCMPELGKDLSPFDRWRVRLATPVTAFSNKTAAGSRIALARTLSGFINPVLHLGSVVSVTPSQLFRSKNNNEQPASLSAPLAKVFLLMTSSSQQITVRKASSDDVARRLVDCAEYERRALLGLYTKFRYAFPDRRSTVIDESREREVAMLTKALKSKDVFVVETPFPFDPLLMYDAVSPFC